MTSVERALRAAVQKFWKTRARQSAAQRAHADRDRGARAAVTGGKQMDGFIRLARERLLEAGVPAASISVDSRIELPGWFRAEKKWDLVVVHDRELVAAAEFKSQVGPSFGNNFNNRAEEAIGSATDIWAAFQQGAFRPSARPFLGYFMLLEDCEKSRSAVRVAEPHFKVFKEFRGASYGDRYSHLLEKLLRDRLYDGACLLLSDDSAARTGAYAEPNSELTFAGFIDPLVERCRRIVG